MAEYLHFGLEAQDFMLKVIKDLFNLDPVSSAMLKKKLSSPDVMFSGVLAYTNAKDYKPKPDEEMTRLED